MTKHSAPPAGSASILVSFAAAAALLYGFRGVLWPLALALVLAILISSIARRILGLWPKASRALIALLAGGLVISALVATFVIVFGGAVQVIHDAPALISRLDQLLGDLPFRTAGGAAHSVRELTATIDVAAALGGVGALRSVASGLTLVCLYMVFLLASAKLIERRVATLAGASPVRTMAAALHRTVGGIEAYLWIQTLTGLMIAIASGGVMLTLGLENALFWTLTLFLLSYMPVVGVAVGSVAPALFALLQFPTVMPAIILLVAIQIIAFVVGNLVLPKMQADTQNIDPAASLLAIGVWSVLWGTPGAFLAIPLTLMAMYQMAQFDRVRWIAVLISNDGHPLPEWLDRGKTEPSRIVVAGDPEC